jgi:hypothetical protein
LSLNKNYYSIPKAFRITSSTLISGDFDTMLSIAFWEAGLEKPNITKADNASSLTVLS